MMSTLYYSETLKQTPQSASALGKWCWMLKEEEEKGQEEVSCMLCKMQLQHLYESGPTHGLKVCRTSKAVVTEPHFKSG